MPRLRATGSKKDSSIELRPIGLALRALSQKGLCPTKRGQYTKGTKPQPKKYKEESSLGFPVPFCDPHCTFCGSFPFCCARHAEERVGQCLSYSGSAFSLIAVEGREP